MQPMPSAFGQVGDVAGARSRVRRDACRIDEARDRVAELHLRLDRVAAAEKRARLAYLLVAAAQDLRPPFGREAAREARQRQRRERPSAHGVDVRERVRRGDRAVVARVVDDGREEIHGLHERDAYVRRQALARAEHDDSGVVERLGSDDHAGVLAVGDVAQHLRELALRQLGRSTGAAGVVREALGVGERHRTNCSVLRPKFAGQRARSDGRWNVNEDASGGKRPVFAECAGPFLKKEWPSFRRAGFKGRWMLPRPAFVDRLLSRIPDPSGVRTQLVLGSGIVAGLFGLVFLWCAHQLDSRRHGEVQEQRALAVATAVAPWLDGATRTPAWVTTRASGSPICRPTSS
jgi:hypothetical protein